MTADETLTEIMRKLDALASIDDRLGRIETKMDRTVEALAEVRASVGVLREDMTAVRTQLWKVSDALLSPSEARDVRSGSSSSPSIPLAAKSR
ncbi:MAG: hypothetical protein AAB706_03375 [Patescibacteria group bacterium]